MPTLEWIGKDKVVNHHQQVPYRVLEAQYTHNAERSENMIIRGDNLEALKSLLPKYEGKVKCIYIDPPYNTGNEGWVYNDNVNDPRIKKWLGEVVGKEGEDLSRHDKWLCMMYPRLKLLHKLLSDNGVIFISIDDNEVANLRNLCDEIFGVHNFVEALVWQKRTSPDARKKLSNGHEYVLIYAKNKNTTEEIFNLLQLEGKDAEQFKNPDNDPRGPWVSSDFTAQGWRPNQMYSITTPSGMVMNPPEGRCWRHLEDVYKHLLKEGRLWFGADGCGVPRKKTYLSEKEGKGVWTWWSNSEVGHTQEATQELAGIIGKAVFDYPKPVRLISRIIRLASSDGDIILDSFAGSGTTAHAVLNLNKALGSKRTFILIEMDDYADSITAERVKRVIDGYTQDQEVVLFDEEITASNLERGAELLAEAKAVAKDAKGKYSSVKKPVMEDNHLKVVAVNKAKDAVPGTGGDFTFYDLGEMLLLPNGNLNENVSADKIREYVYYMETKEALSEGSNGNPYFMGASRGAAYYFYYEKEAITTLDYDFLATIPERADNYIIYADLCTIPTEELAKHSITFKKIPRDIARL